jgi:2-phospho-L-lactate guanylyltransferase
MNFSSQKQGNTPQRQKGRKEDLAMNLWLIIPVKPFGEGKSRLHHVLDASQREALSRRLLRGVIDTVNESVLAERMLVISRDPAVLGLARAAGTATMPETGDELNAALESARDQAMAWGAGAVLILPSDLPLVTVDDLARLYALAAEGEGVVIAPSRDGGTNALLLRPAHLLDFSYGPDSFRRHCQQARAEGHRCRVLESPTLAFDLDWPQDLDELSVLAE